MTTKDNLTERRDPTPANIWLLLGIGDEGSHVWCDDPDPGGNGETEAVAYVRVDTIAQQQALLEECAQALDEIDKQTSYMGLDYLDAAAITIDCQSLRRARDVLQRLRSAHD